MEPSVWVDRINGRRAAKQMFPRADPFDMGNLEKVLLVLAVAMFLLILGTNGEASAQVTDLIGSWAP